MSVKQERPEAVYPPPPPLLQQGVRLRPPMYTPPSSGAIYNYSLNNVPVPTNLQPSPTNLQPSPSPSLGPPSEVQTPSPRIPHDTPEPNAAEADAKDRIDKASVKGTFGWETVDTANIPCIFRDGDKYVSVRMVEQKLLSKYPSTYPDELRNRPPLMSQFITQVEARLLNEINVEHCACEYGQKSFTEKDLVVRLKDFIEFYQIVKKHFPNNAHVNNTAQPHPILESSGGGWVQVNNTVVPYIRRPTPTAREVMNLAPLPVIKYAAGLLTDTDVPSLEPTDDECKLLSDMCKSSGLDFNFSHNTPLILLQQLPVYCATKVVIKRLPDDDPFGNAEYCPDFDTEDYKVSPAVVGGVVLPTMQDLSAQSYQTRLPQPQVYMAQGPPNVTVQPGSLVPFAATNHGARFPKVALDGPARKKARTSASPIEDLRRTPNGAAQRASPVQIAVPGNVFPAGMPRMMHIPPGMPGFRPGLQPFPVRPGSNMAMMAHPGAIQGPPNMWPPAPTNPADMQKLAQMMNMQAAILSGNTQPPTLIQQGKPEQGHSKPVKRQISPTATSTITSQTNVRPNNSAPPQKPAKTATKAKKDSNVERIQPVDFHGKKISCLVKGSTNERFALIEAISRVYYPHCTLEEFLRVMTEVLRIPIYQLDREEEKAFISFYGLPTSSLKCNKVLNLANLDSFMPQLKYMFKKKNDDGSASSRKSTPPPALAKTTQVSASSQDTNNNGAPTTTQSSRPPTNPFQFSAKKPQGSNSTSSSKLSKMTSKLEDAVNRLRQKNLMGPEGTSANTSSDSSAGANALRQGQIPKNPFI